MPGVRSNVFAQSVVLTRIMDYWGRTGGFSIVLPYALIDTSAGPFRASTNGVSDVGFLWQMNIFGGPALTREAVPVLRPADVLELSFAGDDAARHLQSKLADQPEREPLDGLANRQFQLYARSRAGRGSRRMSRGAFFTDNDNYLVNGAQTLSQRPLLRLEEHVSRNVTDALMALGGRFLQCRRRDEHRWIDQDNMANTLRIGAGMGLRLWRGADLGLNYERVVAKPAGEPYSQTVRFTLRQLW